MLSNKTLTATAGSTSSQLFVEDVFSTYLYTGNGTSQTITNGVDLAGRGGMVWMKGRSGATDHALYDTVRGATFDIVSNSIAAQTTQATGLTAFNANGFSIGALAKLNSNVATYTSWTFRKAAKFFDVVTYTGNGANRTIAHALGAVPGMMMVKCTSAVGNWVVWSNALANTEKILLNSIAAKVTDATAWNSTAPTSSVFSLGTHADVNTNGATYVAYLFAHDTSAEGLIQCGGFTTDGSGNATVSLGWEPQFLLCKTTGVSDWEVVDAMRGMSVDITSTSQPRLIPNTNGAEASMGAQGRQYRPEADGFTAKQAASTAHIYLAIRRPNKQPTTGTEVFTPVAHTGTGANTTVSAGFPTDTVIEGNRTAGAGSKFATWDRLRATGYLLTNSVSVETIADTTRVQPNPWDSMTGLKVGTTATLTNATTNTFAYWMFKRTPRFFDVVCDTGTGVAHTINHSLSASPELIIRKSRDSTGQWEVYINALANTEKLVLNTTAAKATDTTAWNSTSPTASVFSVGTSLQVNKSADRYVTYLFATLSGISKVGSYTGNGTSQTIPCGFATGARFVLIKRTDSTGDWFVWDTPRGIVAGNDPHLNLNTTNAEVTTNDSIDPDASGFIVNQVAATDINVNAASYIFLAIA